VTQDLIRKDDTMSKSRTSCASAALALVVCFASTLGGCTPNAEVPNRKLAMLLGRLDRNNPPSTRSNAARRIGEFGAAAEAAVPALIGCLEEDDYGVRIAACTALGKIGSRARSAAPALVRCLEAACVDLDKNSAEFDARAQYAVEFAVAAQHAAEAIGEIGVRDAQPVPALINCLRIPDADVKSAALWTLGRIGPEAKAAVPLLETTIVNGKASETLAARYALARIAGRNGEHLPALIEAMKNKDNNDMYSERLAVALSEFGATVVPAIKALLRNQDAEDAIDAHFVLAMVGDEQSLHIAALISQLGGPSIVRAADRLARLGQAAVPGLTESLASSQSAVRANAALALSCMGYRGRAAVGPLTKCLTDADAVIRGNAASALGSMGAESAVAVKALTKCLADGNAVVRRNATIWSRINNSTF